jgi:crotonobetainyl-CoA:carnitine CoA-transferase CaiB-like acyl-CoA transferase
VPVPQGEEQRLLDGVRIVSLAEQYPGPYATLVLADLGADVIQVERPVGGDPARQFPGFYAAVARNKRSVALDLKSENGLEAFGRLVADADAVIEGFRPGTVDRLGVGYEHARAINPAIVYVSISGYGQDGPYRGRPGHDLAYQAIAGLLAGSESATTGTELQIGDLTAGMFAIIAVALGLMHRARTGSGLYVDVSMLDVLVSMNAARLVPAMNSLAEPLFMQGPAYRTYVARDGKRLALAIAHEDTFWRSLCAVAGLEAYGDVGSDERIARTSELQELLERALSTRSRAEWVELLVAADVPVAPLNDLDDVWNDPQVVSRGLVVEVEGADGTSQAHVRQPLVIPGFSTTPSRPAPRLGEHTEQVLGGEEPPPAAVVPAP